MKTLNEQGQSSNSPDESPIYYAQYPSPEQQQRYLLQGGIAVLFITALILFAVAIS